MKNSRSEIDLLRWKEYPEIRTKSLWIIDRRGEKTELHGAFVPEIPNQLLQRYTKQGEIVLDLFSGDHTTAQVALSLGRRCLGVDIDPEAVSRAAVRFQGQSGVEILQGDSADPRVFRALHARLHEDPVDGVNSPFKGADLLILHPPYWKIIRFSDEEGDLSQIKTLPEFLRTFRQIAQHGYDLLAPDRYAALVIGDMYEKGEWIPLSHHVFVEMTAVGFRPVAEIVKNICGNETFKGRNNNLWRYRHLRNGTYGFDHEKIFVFKKRK